MQAVLTGPHMLPLQTMVRAALPLVCSSHLVCRSTIVFTIQRLKHCKPDACVCKQVYLDPKDRNSTEYKLDTFGSVYKKLTGKDVVFEFPVSSGDIA